MAIVHFILQKKGGVGKSMIASMWMQYLQELGFPVYGLDTDPSNKSFTDFTELEVTRLEILDENDDIDSRRFDTVVETISKLDQGDHLVIDTGSSCYPPLFAYLKHNNPFKVIIEEGHRIYVHTPIGGGGDVIETTVCLEDLVTTFPDLPFIVWKNRYHGDLMIDGKPFEQLVVYPKIKKNIVAAIDIPLKNPATYGKDVELLMAKKHTFREGINSSLPVMVRQRLKIFWKESCKAMKEGLVFDGPVQEANGGS